MRVVAVANRQSGCGKTTTAINLSACWAFLGQRVLLVDLDPRGHASVALGLPGEHAAYTLYDILSPRLDSPIPVAAAVFKLSRNLHLLPSGTPLFDLERELDEAPWAATRLLQRLVPLYPAYDRIVFDCPPLSSLLLAQAFAASDAIVIPFEAGEVSLSELKSLENFTAALQAYREKGCRHHWLAVRVRPAEKITSIVLARLNRVGGGKLLKSVIRENSRIPQAAMTGKAMVDFDRDCPAFQEFMNCAIELSDRADSDEASVQADSSFPIAIRAAPNAPELPVEQFATRQPTPPFPAEAFRGHTFAEENAAMAPVDPRSRSREAQSNSGPSRDASAGSVERERHLGSLIPEDSEDASVSQRSRAERYREAAKFIDGHGAARVCPPSQDGDRLPVQGGKVDAGSSDFRYTITAGAPEGRAPDIEIRFSWQGQTSRGVLFELEVENANLVQIAGEFNDWKPETMARDRTSPRLWRVIKPLPRGEYRYKFVINGRWMNDPLNPKQKPNPFGGTDSILRIADAP